MRSAAWSCSAPTSPRRSALIALTREAPAGRRAGVVSHRLLIAIDQEGGSVKRVPWAPPTITVPQMGQNRQHDRRARAGRQDRRRPAGAGHQRRPRAGRRHPPLDRLVHVPAGPHLLIQGRANRGLADAFAAGLASSGVLATMKHFPGIGLAIAEHGPLRRHHPGIRRPGSRRTSDRIAGDRPRHPADHAVERDVHRLRPGQRGWLVPRDRRHAAARRASGSRA